MGYKQSPALIVVALLLLATATPLAYGQLLQNIGSVTGRICCTSSGNCPPGSVGIPGVAVRLNCTTLLGNVVTLAQGVTNSTGVFNLTLPNLLGSLGPVISTVLPCNVVANLPLNSTVCPILSTVNGTLTGVPILAKTLLSSLLRPIFCFVVAVFNIARIS